MQAPASTPTQPAAPRDYGDALHDLITMGTDVARTLHSQVMRQGEAANAATPPHPAPGTPYQPPATLLVALAAAFDRIARAVRRCILLARTLAQPPRPAPDPAAQRTAARKRILRQVEDRITRVTPECGPDAADALRAELRERLDAPDLDDDIGVRPTEDIIADICRDLGLANLPGAPPWTRRTPADLADLHARAAAPPAPVARPGASSPPGLSAALLARLGLPAHLDGPWRPAPGD